MISLDEARARLLDGVHPLGEEQVALDEALGRVLSRDVVATHTQPPDRRSKMDGIAVATWAALPGDVFPLVGEARAGSPFSGILGAGEAIRIATGSVVPDAAERVIPQEIAAFDGDAGARLIETPGDDSFIRPEGSDFRQGDVLLTRGTILQPGSLGLVAGANCASPVVYRKARVGILTSGDELVAPGSELRPGATIDSASFVIAALVKSWGGTARRLDHLPDCAEETAQALTRASQDFDVLVTIGGASVGARDHFRSAARAIGMDVRFDKIAVQPGKPCWHARGARGGLCLGLPGNPNSAFVCAHLLLKPLLAALHGIEGPLFAYRQARLTGAPIASGERRIFFRGWIDESDGYLTVSPASDQDSGLQSVLAGANCLIDLAPQSRLEIGGKATVIRLDESCAVAGAAPRG